MRMDQCKKVSKWTASYQYQKIIPNTSRTTLCLCGQRGLCSGQQLVTQYAQLRYVRRSTKTNCSKKLDAQTSPLTARMFKKLNDSFDEQQGGAGGGTTQSALLALDAYWEYLKQQPGKEQPPQPPKFITTSTKEEQNVKDQYDIVVGGGNLGVFLAAALQQQGLKVCVIERGKLIGRAQEWNISRKELQTLIKLKVLTEQQCENAIVSEWNPVQCVFAGSDPVITNDILNIGVAPTELIQSAKENFVSAGGTVLEFTGIDNITVSPLSATLQISPKNAEKYHISSKLFLDCMGNRSPAVQQARNGAKPDGMCIVVGSCCRGFPESANQTSDVIATYTDAQPPNSPRVNDIQFFWEAFPASGSKTDRTTYMFTYIDCEEYRPSIVDLMEEYWHQMPRHQGVDLDQLTPVRCLFGIFPAYRDSPLKPAWDRVLQVGDASGIQSPLSFGGLGALTRHLPRLVPAIHDAITLNQTTRAALSKINAYNPGLSVAWLFQRAMSVRKGAGLPANTINRLLANNFAAMEKMGDHVLRPFLQDVVKVGPLSATFVVQGITDPLVLPDVIRGVGVGELVGWVRHFVALFGYTVAFKVLGGWVLGVSEGFGGGGRFWARRMVEEWQYGAGLDEE